MSYLRIFQIKCPKNELSRMLKPDGFTGERLQFDLEQETVFGLRLCITERGYHGRSWLKKMHTVLCAFIDLWNAFMLMSPDH
jgi:hypothetical protein